MYNNPIFPPPQQPKCCGCISLRFGGWMICLIWAAFSMYLAVLSFQNSSLFYSYLPQAAITVYGVVNLILSLVSVGGLIILIVDVGRHVRTFSHAIFVCVFLVLVDGFINIILFITNQSNFNNWCVTTSSQTIIQNVNASGANTTLSGFDFTNGDFYNCHNLWQDELKFGIIFYILMFAFYVYWALCIYSFSLVRRSYHTSADLRDANIPMGPGGAVAMPPPAMINNGGVAGAGPFPNDRSVIVLNNHKPRSKSTKKKDTFSFRNIKRSIAPSSAITPMQDNHHQQLQVPFGGTTRRDSQFTIGFRLGPDGNIVDIENAPSPTPTFINNNSSSLFENQPLNNKKQQQLKRKSLSKEELLYHQNKKQYYDDDDDENYY